MIVGKYIFNYIVKADIEFAHGNNIPLWHFGFLY